MNAKSVNLQQNSIKLYVCCVLQVFSKQRQNQPHVCPACPAKVLYWTVPTLVWIVLLVNLYQRLKAMKPARHVLLGFTLILHRVHCVWNVLQANSKVQLVKVNVLLV